MQYTHNYELYYIRYLIVLEGYNDTNWIFKIKTYSIQLICIHISKCSCTMEVLESINYYPIHYGILIQSYRWMWWRDKMVMSFLEDILGWPVLVVSIYCNKQYAISSAWSIMCNGKSRLIRCRENTVRQLILIWVIFVD